MPQVVALSPGTVVRYATPRQGEESLRFVVIEDRGDRVLIESLNFPNWRIKPQELVARDELARIM
jgi:hypothetical protein